jgi:hypothetical protein
MRIRTVLSSLLILTTALTLQQTIAQGQFTSTIRGRVADDVTHEGVSAVRVTLTGSGQPVVVTSDGQGNIQFPSLNAGRYSLATDKAGYFPQTFSDILVGGAETGNGIVSLGDLGITAQRTISGTVKWDDDEPVTNGIVHIMGFIGGSFSRAAFARTAQTNDRGEFRLEGLRARRYVVFAYLRPQVAAPGAANRVALPVFYPGANRPDGAQVFDLRTTNFPSGLVRERPQVR